MSSSSEQAEQLKQQGNEFYKQRQFDNAIELYKQAYTLDNNITYLTNQAAALFEKGDYDECIQVCDNAIEQGREQRADFKVIAKAFGRIGSAYLKKKDFENAIKFFNKSLTEHRTPDILTKLKQTERERDEQERLAYIDPQKADQARELGNKAFKSGDFAGSVTHYTESIKRNPSDPRGYTNKAAALTKLLALPEALKQAEQAIQVDPTFVKGYIRKANVLLGMKEYSKATAAIEEAAEKDTEHKNQTEITQTLRKITEAEMSTRSTETDEQAYARAMRDPEVQNIMSDPVMQSILSQAQREPESLMSHLQNPEIRKKIDVLVRAGIIRTGPR
ncbi:Hsp90 cochaperone [Microbotryomycetes sp. JL221]|nr:Hsp90 cochaperone [Microbotryomycetes sp. JL221]